MALGLVNVYNFHDVLAYAGRHESNGLNVNLAWRDADLLSPAQRETETVRGCGRWGEGHAGRAIYLTGCGLRHSR